LFQKIDEETGEYGEKLQQELLARKERNKGEFGAEGEQVRETCHPLSHSRVMWVRFECNMKECVKEFMSKLSYVVFHLSSLKDFALLFLSSLAAYWLMSPTWESSQLE
jgi:hypothetical protein